MALKIIEHPLIKDKMTRIRKKTTNMKVFKENIQELTKLMAYEILSDIKLEEITIETPLAKTRGYKINENIVIIPVLRAGLAMVESILSLIPKAKVGHIGLYRDKVTLQPKEYFSKKPANTNGSYTLILDPMLATGRTAVAAISWVKSWGASNIKLISLLGTKEGVTLISQEHPDVDIYLAAPLEKLDENCYISPGLGDAGDRYFGTND